MSTVPHPEAAGLAAALCNPMCHHEGKYKECDKYADAALSWLTARLTDDDVVEAVARAIFVVLEPAPNAQGDRDRQTRLRLVAMRQSREAARVAIAAQGETIGGK